MKKLRTPIIKPRTQGGTFYTFGSAMEDIGLNIDNTSNIISLSHYVLLDIPEFDSLASGPDGSLHLNTQGSYGQDASTGDYMFAEYFQDAILNMETTLRNQDDYNYATYNTVSERVFWKWMFKDTSLNDFVKISSNGTAYYYQNTSSAIAKAFGRIISSSQRADDSGIYNETFVQIPSSYGQMRVFFKEVNDENYKYTKEYESTNNGTIEGIDGATEMDSTHYLKSTGIYGMGKFDTGTKYKNPQDASVHTGMFEAELSIENLRSIYGSGYENITIDDIGFGNVPGGNSFPEEFSFNAILVYYSIYDATGTNVLATNAFGVYLLDKAKYHRTSNATYTYKFPEKVKVKSNVSASGTSFSFRLNIKPTSAYSGDIRVFDNSTSAFADSENFNDVVKNLSSAINILKSNTRLLSEIAMDNQELKQRVNDATDKIDDLSKTIDDIRSGRFESVRSETLYAATNNRPSTGIPIITKATAMEILNNTTVKYDYDTSIGQMIIEIDTQNLSADALAIANGMKIGNGEYYDVSKMMALVIVATKD